MNKLSPEGLSLIILALTIPFALFLSFLGRVLGLPATPEGSVLLADILKFISGGILGILAGEIKNKLTK